jgi:hypothetical protein
MKKFLAAALILFSANSFAQFYPGHIHHHHHSSNDWVGPLIGGAIIGAVISDITRPRHYDPRPPVVIHPQIFQNNNYSCLVQVYDPITRTVRNEVMVCTR